MKVYIASSSKTEDDLKTIKVIENLLEKNSLDYYVQVSESSFDPSNFRVLFTNNLTNLKNSDLLLVVINNASHDIFYSIGYMYSQVEMIGLSKIPPIITFSTTGEQLGLMIQESTSQNFTKVSELSKFLSNFSRSV